MTARLKPDPGHLPLTILVQVAAEPLQNRCCSRCGGTDFRALVGTYERYRAKCDRFTCRGDSYCGRSLRKGPDPINCGDWRNCDVWDAQSPASKPLAACMGCGRLVDLM